MQDDLRAYKLRQQQAWGSAIGFHRLSGAFLPASRRLVGWLGITAGDHVLDIATATGRTAVLARATGASVTAQDLSPVLLGEAEHFALASGYSDIEFSESDAEELPFPGGRFSVVVSTFGAIHVPRADIVSSEMNRVLASGGRLGLATWRHDAAIHRLTRLLPDVDAGRVGTIDPAEWGREERVREFVSRRYFPEIEFVDGTLEFHYPSAEAAWRDWSRNYGPLRAGYQSLPLRNRDAVAESAREFFGEWATDSGAILWPLTYLLVKATKIGLNQRIG